MEEELSLETSDVADGWVGPTKKAMGARGSKASLYLTFLIKGQATKYHFTRLS
jgi:hypothetical protein